MNALGEEESKILQELCAKHNVNPDYLRVLILTKKEFSYKSSAKTNELRNEISKLVQLWARKNGVSR